MVLFAIPELHLCGLAVSGRERSPSTNPDMNPCRNRVAYRNPCSQLFKTEHFHVWLFRMNARTARRPSGRFELSSRQEFCCSCPMCGWRVKCDQRFVPGLEADWLHAFLPARCYTRVDVKFSWLERFDRSDSQARKSTAARSTLDYGRSQNLTSTRRPKRVPVLARDSNSCSFKSQRRTKRHVRPAMALFAPSAGA